MPLSAPVYCTRENVKSALDSAETARNNDLVDRAIETARDSVDGLLRRRFTPWVGTRHFRWPNPGSPTSWRLWLDRDELVSLTSLTAGGTTISTADVFLEPANDGPPYRSIEVDQSSSAAFASTATSQRAIAVTGTFGYRADEETVGSLAGNLAASTTATASITWTTARIGVGDLLHIDDERMLVTERTMVDSTQDNPTLTASMADVSVAVTNGTAFAVEEIILIGSERMRIVDIAGNTLTVKRAWDGTVLAAHSPGGNIYTLTGVTLLRAQCGSTLAAHSTSAAITRHVVPALVRDLAVAYALNQLGQESSGYARTVGAGENQQEATGKGLKVLQSDALEAHGRQLLARAV
jgi:hypothetical protein